MKQLLIILILLGCTRNLIIKDTETIKETVRNETITTKDTVSYSKIRKEIPDPNKWVMARVPKNYIHEAEHKIKIKDVEAKIKTKIQIDSSGVTVETTPDSIVYPKQILKTEIRQEFNYVKWGIILAILIVIFLAVFKFIKYFKG